MGEDEQIAEEQLLKETEAAMAGVRREYTAAPPSFDCFEASRSVSMFVYCVVKSSTV